MLLLERDWKYVSLIPALGSLRKEACECEVCSDYSETLTQNNIKYK